MIKELELINAQRIKKKTISLTKGFNCIRGGNQRGKSTVIRVLKWQFDNAPKGNWMRRKDKKGKIYTTSVKTTKFDGTVIIRKRGKGKNCYIVNEDKFDDIGKVVPEAVTKAIGINRQFINKTGINPYFSMQGKSPFLMDVSGTVRAKAINLLTGADLAEETIRDYNKEKMSLKKEVKFNKEQFKIYKLKLARYKVLDSLPMDELKKRHQAFVDTNLKLSDAMIIRESIRDKLKIVKSYEKLSKVYVKINEACEIYPDVQAVSDMLEKVLEIKSSIDGWNNYKCPVKVDVEGAMTMMTLIEETGARIEKLECIKKEISNYRRRCNEYKNGMFKLGAMLDKASMRCPKCKTKIPFKGML